MYLAHNLILTPSYISWLTMRVNGLKKKPNKNFLSCSIKMVHLKWWILTKKHKRIFLMQTEQSKRALNIGLFSQFLTVVLGGYSWHWSDPQSAWACWPRSPRTASWTTSPWPCLSTSFSRTGIWVRRGLPRQQWSASPSPWQPVMGEPWCHESVGKFNCK